MRRWVTGSIGIATAVLLLASGCERSEQSHAPAVSPAASTQPSEDELASMRDFVAESAPPRATQQMPPGHPPIMDPGTAAPPPTASASLQYAAPSGWQREQVGSSMRKDQYRLPHAEGDAEDGMLTVFYFGPGGGGGVEANIERWRAQFKTADGKPVPDEAVTRQTLEINDLTITFLEVGGHLGTDGLHVSSTSQPGPEDYHMLGAIVETPGGPWFFKAIGPTATIRSHRAGFRELLESMKAE